MRIEVTDPGETAFYFIHNAEKLRMKAKNTPGASATL